MLALLEAGSREDSGIIGAAMSEHLGPPGTLLGTRKRPGDDGQRPGRTWGDTELHPTLCCLSALTTHRGVWIVPGMERTECGKGNPRPLTPDPVGSRVKALPGQTCSPVGARL